MSLNDIDQHISNLREEERQMQEVYKKLARFLHKHAILPINDDYPEYIWYFIREEQLKQSAGARNSEVIANLEKLLKEFTEDIERFKKVIENDRNSENDTGNLQPENVFTLVGSLYRLRINGQQIREQVNAIEIVENKSTAKDDVYVELPAKVASSKLMTKLENIISE